jgi:dihydrofolate reductase
MRKLIVFMHTSLDGFVAGPKGEMDWILVDDDIFEYANKQCDEADTALYGRVTYEMMQGYWPTAGEQPIASQHDIKHSRWYNSVEKVVVSTTFRGKLPSNTRTFGKNLATEIRDLKEEKGKNILMFGSPTTAHALMNEDLIDEYWIFVNPIILGSGIPLFSPASKSRSLKLESSHAFQSGVVGLHYLRGEK